MRKHKSWAIVFVCAAVFLSGCAKDYVPESYGGYDGNYLYIGNYQNREAIFQECLELFKDKIKVFHIKDFVIENDQIVEVEIGKGIMGWHKFLPIIKEKYPEAILVFEGVKNVPASLQFVKKVLYD